MKKHHITAIVAGLLIFIGGALGRMNRDFFMGCLTGASVLLLIVATFGQWLQMKHQERMDKLRRDEIESRD